MITWVKGRHEYWWNILLDRVYVPKQFNRTMPKIKFTTRPSKVAGRACNNWCEYNLNYVLQEQGTYDDTICHEVCHTFAERLIPGTKHYNLWAYLYNIVCSANRGRYHDYKIVNRKNQAEEIKKIEELLKMQVVLKKISACMKQ